MCLFNCVILLHLKYCKTRKKYDDKISQKCLKQFSRLLKFTNLASEPQKILTYLFMFPECVIQVMHCDYFMGWSCLPPEAHLGHVHYSIHLVKIKWLILQNDIIGVVCMYVCFILI